MCLEVIFYRFFSTFKDDNNVVFSMVVVNVFVNIIIIYDNGEKFLDFLCLHIKNWKWKNPPNDPSSVVFHPYRAFPLPTYPPLSCEPIFLIFSLQFCFYYKIYLFLSFRLLLHGSFDDGIIFTFAFIILLFLSEVQKL
jgi:hypothetical protein